MRLKRDSISKKEKLEIHEFSKWILNIGNGIIAPRNKTVDEINEYILSLVPMELKTIIAMIQYFHHPDT